MAVPRPGVSRVCGGVVKDRRRVRVARRYGERCIAPSAIAAAQLLQQNVWLPRSTIVLRSMIVDSQCAHRGAFGCDVPVPEAMATQFRQQYDLPADSCIVLWSVMSVPQ